MVVPKPGGREGGKYVVLQSSPKSQFQAYGFRKGEEEEEQFDN